MKESDIKHLEWIYNRMIHVHGEDKDFDYMIKFRNILDEMKSTKLVKLTKSEWIPNPYIID
jgi:hypothetical protein